MSLNKETKPNQIKPNQIKPNQTKPNQEILHVIEDCVMFYICYLSRIGPLLKEMVCFSLLAFELSQSFNDEGNSMLLFTMFGLVLFGGACDKYLNILIK